MSSSRSKRTSTSSPSRSVSSSSPSSSTSSGTTSKGGAGTARSSPSRTASRSTTSTSSTSSSSPSSSTSSKGGAGTARASPSRTASRSTTTTITTPSKVKDTTVSSSVDTVQDETIVIAPIETIPEVVYVEPPIEEIIIEDLPKVFLSVPKSGTISFKDITENSVMVSWSPNSLPITGYHLVIKNEDTGQTIHVLDPISGMTNTIFSNLDSGTNYKAYLIVVNDIGNSPEVSKDFKTLGVKVIEPIIMPIIMISPEVQAILTKLDNNDYTYPQWFNNNIKWVKDGTITSNEFLIAFNNLLQTGVIIDKSAPPIEDTTISLDMVSQSIGAFKLENGKVTGDIIYIAESSFNPYYYNKPLTSVVSIKDQSGRTIKLKTNNLNFTETERDERISINEGIGDIDAVKIEFLVWKSVDNPIAFSKKKITEIVCVIALLGGVTAILGTLALLGSKSR